MINGFIIVDKPAGITSHDVVSRIRRIFGTRKVGHTGTLDPFATGVLPVAVNDGTKAIPFLDEGSKTYVALLRLGTTTDTLDMTGTILAESPYLHVTESEFLACLGRFSGQISQIPPMYSAIKQNGQPLYKLARQGIEVERAARTVWIHSLELLSFNLPYVAIRVVCSRGTYVRTLAEDIGAMLGCGAALQELRRTASGPFTIDNAHSLESLKEQYELGSDVLQISPFDALSHLHDIELTELGVRNVSFGRAPRLNNNDIFTDILPNEAVMVRLSYKSCLIAVAAVTLDEASQPAVVLKRVFM